MNGNVSIVFQAFSEGRGYPDYESDCNLTLTFVQHEREPKREKVSSSDCFVAQGQEEAVQLSGERRAVLCLCRNETSLPLGKEVAASNGCSVISEAAEERSSGTQTRGKK